MLLKKLSLLFSLLLLTQFSFAQIQSEEKVFEFVESMPAFPGGEAAMYTYLGNNINFPRSVQEDSTFSGETVYINFVVNKKGEITRAKIKKANCIPCAKEALRIVKKMPRWKAGMQNGRAVKVRYTLPIQFLTE